MEEFDNEQSFTATLKINNKPVVLAQKLLQKKLEDPNATETQRRIYQEELETTHNLLTFSDGVAPEEFYFGYRYGDDVYVIYIKDDNDDYKSTVSMEGTLRNWSVFNGDQPTYFRMQDRFGSPLRMTDIPSGENEILLYSGPQLRPVCTYGEEPYIQVITDLPNRGGRIAAFNMEIITRYSISDD
ncbi:hypothetical protein D3C85_966410 [compost metagenome]|uniref:hypothetical protein n=1 Tax=Pseudomonas fluorescens TaxID=294 RepID=UPI000FA5B39F|nr:hypothetical protein [Pseudomonas fluorescens]VVQ15066.1 hypothetical protein PS934_04181 [Pseudomonas fluorescens]